MGIDTDALAVSGAPLICPEANTKGANFNEKGMSGILGGVGVRKCKETKSAGPVTIPYLSSRGSG
jgi:hypothetical protein